MAITTTERDAIIKLVIGMFNAAPGSVYLSTITSIYEANGHNMTALAQTLSTTSAFQASYPNFQTTSEFVTSFLTKLGLNTNQTAIDYVTAQVNAGVNKGEIILNAITILDKIDPAVGGQIGAAAGALDNKAAVATYYTVDKNGSSTSLSTLQTVIAGVTDSAATVTTAKAGIDAGTLAPVNAGTSLSLTTAIGEQVVGTAGDDTITAVFSNGNTATDSTLNLSDSVDGGSGNDTLTLTATATNSKLGAGVSIKNVETVNVVVTAATVDATAGATDALNAANYTGVTKLVEVDNGTAIAFQAMTVNTGVTAGFKSTGVDSTAQTLNLATALVVAGAAQTALTVSLDGVKGGTVTAGTTTVTGGAFNITGTKVDTLNLGGTLTSGGVKIGATTAGTDLVALKAINLAFTSAATVDLSGLTSAVNFPALATIDGSASTAALNLSNAGLTKVTTFKGGSGNDTLAVDFGANTTTALAVDAGAGTDTVTLTASAGPATGGTIALGAGKDTLKIGAITSIVNVTDTTSAATVTAKLVTVSDFKTAEDTLNLNGQGTALTGAQLTSIAGAADLKAAATAAVTAAGANKAAVFSFGGDAYVVIDSNNSGAFNNGDGLIKLVGVDATQFTNVQNGNLVL